MAFEQSKELQSRITYADDVEARPRAPAPRRTGSIGSRRNSLSIAPLRRRSVDPALALPPQFRTLSFGVEEKKSQGPNKLSSGTGKKGDKAEIDFNELDYHRISVDELYSRFSTSPSQGLSSEQVARKLSEYGPNAPSPPPSRWFRKTMSYLFGGFGAILFIAAILVFIAWKPLGEPAPAVANLALAIVLVIVWIAQASFNFWQDFSTSRVMDSINTMLPDSCDALRDGNWQRIDGKAIVPGDVLKLTMGNKLPADVRFVECSSARIDRAILTGETMPLLGSTTSTDDNYLETACIGLAGTHIVTGQALGLVVSTGDSTVFGRIAKLTSAPKTGLTPLQKEILYFVAIIVSLMLTMIVVVIIVWAAWLRKAYPDWISVPTLIVDCVSVAVAFIPEGLPIAVTASLTIVAGIMKKNKVLCKTLSTVETLGAVQVICSDKTGTLTKNQMSVTDYMVGLQPELAVKAAGLYNANKKALTQLALLAGVCNAGEFDASTVKLPIADRKINGDATDQAILRFAESMTPVSDLRGTWQIPFKLAFNSKNKFMINIIKKASQNLEHDCLLTIKGAPDILLPRCTSYMAEDGTIQPLGQAAQTFETMKNRWSAQGKRVLLLAQKPLGRMQYDPETHPREYEDQVMSRGSSGLTLVGIVGIVDPPRAEIPEVVRVLRGAGVRIFMVTGDFKITAQAIAAECGIITSRQVDNVDTLTSSSHEKEKVEPHGSTRAIVLSGSDLELLDKEHWDELAHYEEIVFARTTPEHKLRIVKELQARDLTVGMTGDGVNDAPSLKAADIGIAMGSGSDIAIEAADMVLLESFAAIVEAVRYGRVVYDNLKKTVCYLLPAGSFSEFWPVMTNVLFGLPQILSSFLMIIICTMTDCAAATAIAYEKPEADVMNRPPRNAKKDRLVDWKLIVHAYGFIGVFQTVMSFTMSYWYCQKSGLSFSSLWFGFGSTPSNLTADEYSAILATASSIYFSNLVIMQWFNLMATRTRRLSIFQHPPAFNKLTQNYLLFPAILFALVIIFIFCYIPQLQPIATSSQIPVEFFFLPMALGFGLLLLDEGRKWCVRKWPSGFLAKTAW